MHYLLDTHVHTDEVSPCGKVTARRLVNLYKEAGYDGIVITDHYYEGFFATLPDWEWSRKVDAFLEGYRKARAQGEKVGLDVFLGAEFRFTEHENDYLVYGIDREFLVAYPCLYDLGLAEFRQLIHNRGILVYQAHPFRTGMIPAKPALLDGVEVFNGNPRHDSLNRLALEFARKNGLKMSSGSDFHQVEDLAGGGVVLNERITSHAKLVELLQTEGVAKCLGIEE
jgi:predicted metal-dependent phosphoesterase TrpH